ncbi:hypothetical protein CEE39_00760 [bacterium (candidate division B38) B3_B38]|nr:MAG: hypothetical protein CEE39_00760 [bacterium (candidate division B38) B3_B38]
MEAWELDWPGTDDYIEKMTYPDCSIILDCIYGSCNPAITEWKNPTAWDSGHILDAKIRLKVYGAELKWEEGIP